MHAMYCLLSHDGKVHNPFHRASKEDWKMAMELTVNIETSRASSLFGRLAAAVEAAARRRRRRIALAELMRMNPARLDDLGLQRQDVLLARSAGTSAEPLPKQVDASAWGGVSGRAGN
jgi:uncharacterized protein YjiS (DUF1127 family)